MNDMYSINKIIQVKCFVLDQSTFATVCRMDLFSMGMFILDEIRFPDRTVHDIIGGAGTYTVLSGGVFLKPEERHKVGMIIDLGSDFPANIREEIENWKLGIVWRKHSDRLTTRGLNVYGPHDQRDFEYVTPKLRIEAQDILSYPQCANAKALHIISSPRRCLEICKSQIAAGHDSQLFVWEPVPTECLPELWPQVLESFPVCACISPNAREAAMFVGQPEPMTKDQVEKVAEKFKDYHGILVIRCGADGCLLVHGGKKQWFRAYHLSSEKVVDPTGGGNSFLGGFAISLARDPKNVTRAIVWGTVAAGLAIEQIGLPKCDATATIWNGEDIQPRIEKYMRREDLM